MATISENIQRINKAKTDIKNAIIAKGGSVADGDKIDTYATAIEALPSGGGAELPQNLSRLVTDDWGNPKKITIKGSVTTIPNDAYKDAELKEVIIGNGVTSIGDYAFCACSNLSSVTIPDSVTSIGSQTFYNCSSLTGITIPDSVTSIGSQTFYNCSRLASVVIGNGITVIYHQVFMGCQSLTGITIPDSVTSIGSQTFYNCLSLTGITIPDSVTSIGSKTFYNCLYLKSIIMKSDTPPLLADSSVLMHTGMCPIIVPTGSGDVYKSASSWQYYANRIVESDYVPSFEVTELRYTGQTGTTEFTAKDITEITSADTRTSSIDTLAMAVIGDKVATIGENAFRGASNLTNVYFSDNSQLETIGSYAFYACSTLTGITIPDNTTSIGPYAFYACSNLSSVTIPDSVTSIGDGAFNYDWIIKTFTVKATTPPTLGSDVIPIYVTAIYVPSNSIDTYKSASGWSKFADKIQPIQ